MGVTSKAYREKKKPVLVRAVYCAKEILSVGRCRSKKEAPEIIHLDMGAQKWTVKGPASAAATVLIIPRLELFAKAADQLLAEAQGYGSNDFKIPLTRRVLISVLKEATQTGAAA